MSLTDLFGGASRRRVAAAALDPTFTVRPLCGYAVRHVCARCSTHLLELWKFRPCCGRPRDSELEDVAVQNKT